MKVKFFSVPEHLPEQTLMTFCIGFGCAWPLMLSMNLVVFLPLCALCCAAVTLAFSLLDCLPRLRALAYPLLLGAVLALAYACRSQFEAISNALTLFLGGQPLALAAYSRAIIVLLSLLLTGVGASLARSGQSFFPLALLCILMLFAVSFLGVNISAVAFLPLILALLLSCRAWGVRSARLVLCSLLVLACLSALLPVAGASLPSLSDAARQMRQRIDDYLFFTDPRTAFSLGSAGWQPLGASQLGGAVAPSDDPVMQVRVSSRALLRGTVKNGYTGSAWEDVTSGRRYLMISPRFASLRRDLFDLSRPPQSVQDDLPAYEAIQVAMFSESASTLYLTQRFQSPAGEGLVPYFSPSSEVFVTRSLAPGDVYSFSGRNLTSASAGVRKAVLAAESADDPYYETVRQSYTALPQGIDVRVYELARQITSQAGTDFDRAAALCGYLQRSFPYTLNQSTPPAGRDFVSWFLLEEQQGYCTSFASAMAVMARAIGLPSRYIEGYAAQPEEDGVARVTQQDAHAWVEIYFPGFGWLTFDPTPGQGTAPRQPDASDDSGPQADDDRQYDPERSPEPTQEPTPSPEPTPTPTPTPVPTPTPSPTPQHDDPSVTPTPEITPQPTPTPSPVPTPEPEQPPQDDDDSFPWLWLVLIALLILAACALRFVLCSPAYLASRSRSVSDALLVWYSAVTQALCALGVTAAAGEAPASFLLRAQEQLGGSPALTPLGKALCIARYSRHKPSRTQLVRAQKTYDALLRRMTLHQRLCLYALRFRYGLKV